MRAITNRKLYVLSIGTKINDLGWLWIASGLYVHTLTISQNVRRLEPKRKICMKKEW